MNPESIEKLKQLTIVAYRKLGDMKGLTIHGHTYTGNEIADEIENETQLGIDMVGNLLILTIDLLSRDKINTNETK